jgi:hypothetical protein
VTVILKTNESAELVVGYHVVSVPDERQVVMSSSLRLEEMIGLEEMMVLAAALPLVDQ